MSLLYKYPMKKAMRICFLFLCCLLVFVINSHAVLAQSTSQPMDNHNLRDLETIFRETTFYEDCEPSNAGSQSTTNSTQGPVYMLGDSITSIAKNDLQREFDEADIEVSKINADSGRAISRDTVGSDPSGIEAVQNDEEDIKNSKTVIVALGTNSSGGVENLNVQIPKLLQKIRAVNNDVKIFWVNIFSQGGVNRSSLNRIIKDRATQDNYSVIDTVDAGIDLAGDQQHPTASGSKTFAKTVVKGIGAGPTTSVPTNGAVKTTKPIPSTDIAVGDAFKGAASNYGHDPVTGYADPADNNIPALRGMGDPPDPNATNDEPGIAVWNMGTLGGWWLVTTAEGGSAILRQTDFGPSAATAFIDINTVAVRSVFGKQNGNTFLEENWTFKYLGKTKPAGAITDDTGRREDRTSANPDANTSGEGGNGGCTCQANGTTQAGSNPQNEAEAEKQIFNFYKNEGYTAEQAAGFVGNYYQESGYNPALENSIGAYGIAQWLGGRRTALGNFAGEKNKPDSDFQTQLEFSIYELKGIGNRGGSESAAQSAITAVSGSGASAVELVTVVIRVRYERPGEAEANDARRIAKALEIYEKFGDGSGGTVSGNSTLSGGCAGGTQGSGVSSGSFIWPLESNRAVSSCYGYARGRLHTGIDIAAPRGDPIKAADGGTVELARDSDPGGFGKAVIIKHENGFWTLYAHLHTVSVSQGQQVDQGQVIGTVNDTGSSQGDHLHFNIQKQGGEGVGTEDPLDHLPKDPVRQVSGGDCPASLG
jgi:murein DD-endopeptidase MepM/ murein hydrolase activator NlpD